MTKISVILPIYNGEKTVRETIHSVLNQTLTNFELIVINDGSQDNTLDIIGKITDARIQVYSYTNAGQAASRNRGIERAKGEYIAFIDADDLWTPDKLESQLQALQDNPTAALAYSWTDYIDESGKLLHPGRHTTANGNVLEKLIVNNFIENGSNPLIRQEVFEKVGVFEESLPPAEDWDLWLRIAEEYQFICIPAAQILYRVTVNSSSSNIIKQEIQCRKVLDAAFDRAPDSLQFLKSQSFANLYKYLTWKAIEGYPSRRNGIAAARCFWYYLQYNPSVVVKPRFMGSVLFKIASMVFLPPRQARAIIKAVTEKV
ncbi:MAG: glycosyltransferase [Cyanobacteriota bacterium]|nr:glycosyltransferase [Cyanobacteriota bacterium]